MKKKHHADHPATPEHTAPTEPGTETYSEPEAAGPTGDELKEQYLTLRVEVDQAKAALDAALAREADVEHEIGKRLDAKRVELKIKNLTIRIGDHEYGSAKAKDKRPDGAARYVLRKVGERTAVDL